jgi:hypothetical protein
MQAPSQWLTFIFSLWASAVCLSPFLLARSLALRRQAPRNGSAVRGERRVEERGSKKEMREGLRSEQRGGGNTVAVNSHCATAYLYD